MSTVLTNGIIIPDNGNRNWGGDLANNWNIIDLNVGYMNDVKNRVTTLETSVAENTANIQTNASNISALQTSKQDALSDQQIANIANVTNKANDSDVVHKSGDETIAGSKTFSKARTKFYKALDLYHNEDYKLNTNPSTKAYQYVFFAGKSGWYSAFLENQVDSDGASYCNLLTRNTNEQSATIQLAIDSKGAKTFKPDTNNDISLGTTTNKWKTLNGINPGALSLPSMSFISLDTTGFDVTSMTIGTFTPTIDGWAILSITQKNKPFGIWILQGSYRVTFQSVCHQGDYMIFALIPVRTNLNLTIYCTADDIDSTRKVDWLRLFPCQGNV